MVSSDLSLTLSLVPLIQVFFKAGLLGYLEELRDERLAKVLTLLQAVSRGKIIRMALQRMSQKKYVDQGGQSIFLCESYSMFFFP